MPAFNFNRTTLYLGASLLASVLSLSVQALPLQIRPIDFGDGLVASGSVVTDDTSGNIVDWNVAVRSTTRLAHYTKGNTPSVAIDQTAVSSDGQRLTVATSPDSANVDGGQLFMRASNPFIDFGVSLADFTGANAVGGQAMYMAGAAFDFLSLGAPDASEYTVATQQAPGSRTYDLAPLSFSGGVTLSGTLTTDGTLGALGAGNLVGWDIVVDQVFEDVFDRSNSVMSASQIAFDPSLGAVLVDNPDGLLSFDKGPLGARRHALVLADFTDPNWAFGKAGYYQGRLAIYERALGAGRGKWRVTGTDAIGVPEPTTLALSLYGVLLGVRCSSPRARRIAVA